MCCAKDEPVHTTYFIIRFPSLTSLCNGTVQIREDARISLYMTYHNHRRPKENPRELLFSKMLNLYSQRNVDDLFFFLLMEKAALLPRVW